MQDVSLFFRALADRKRLQIAEYLAQHSSVTVTDLGEALRMSQPLISWHLRILRRAGVVRTRRAGRQVFCSLNRSGIHDYAERIDDLLGLGDNKHVREEGTPDEASVSGKLKGVELWEKSG